MRNDENAKRRLRALVREQIARTNLKGIVREQLACTDLRALVQEVLHEQCHMTSATGPVQPRVLH